MVRWLGLTILLAACSIIYELMLASTLALLTGDHVWWYSATIAVFISGLALGSYLATKRTITDYTFLKVELLLSSLGVFSIFWVMFVHWAFYLMEVQLVITYTTALFQYSSVIKAAFFLLTQGLVFGIGILSGFEIPLILRELKKSTGKELENVVIALNYFGTLLGTLLFSLFLYNYLNLIMIGVVVGLGNLWACWLMNTGRSKKLIISTLLITLGAFALGQKNTEIEQIYLKTRYYLLEHVDETQSPKSFFSTISSLPKVERLKSLYQKIDFVQDKNPNSKDLTMYLDTNFQFSTKNEQNYHETFTHVSLALASLEPKTVLVLGAGDGLLIRELLKYPSITKIKHIELDGKILEMFKALPLSKLNDNALSDPRVDSEVGDGFFYARNTNDRFDAVFIDFPHPKTYDLTRLYSIEFYQNIKRILHPKGIAVMDFPVEFLTPNQPMMLGEIMPDRYRINNIIFSTLFYSGFRSIIPIKTNLETFIMMSPSEFKVNYTVGPNFTKLVSQVTPEEVKALQNLNCPYKITKEEINSIFFPKIIDQKSMFPVN
jgi:spermidine synthase